MEVCGRWVFGLLLGATIAGCRCGDSASDEGAASLDGGSPGSSSPRVSNEADKSTLATPTGNRREPPRRLFLPDAGGVGEHGQYRACPPEMVNILGRYCIDRFEGSLVDTKQQRKISPYYHPTVTLTRVIHRRWLEKRFTMGDAEHQSLPVPAPPAFQFKENFQVAARSVVGVTPQGYMSGLLAEKACANAGKRLCSEDEWVTACRGESNRKFPYGSAYERGKCNVKNGKHPAKILHGSAAVGHLDPRLNHFKHRGAQLLHETGENVACASRWGEDAVYDMVGNIDEWIADAEGKFLGGFYSRNTEDGCLASISAHPRTYFDYSLGVRCCL